MYKEVWYKMGNVLELVSWLLEIHTILTFSSVFLLLYYGFKKRKNLPPGPLSLPLVGNLPSLIFHFIRTRDEPEYLFAKMAKQYGDVFSLRVGTKLIVVMNRCNAIKEAFGNPLMNDRPRSKPMEEADLNEGNLLRPL